MVPPGMHHLRAGQRILDITISSERKRCAVPDADRGKRIQRRTGNSALIRGIITAKAAVFKVSTARKPLNEGPRGGFEKNFKKH